MEKMIAFCGLVCTDCQAYLATQKNDDEERKKVAERWSSEQFPLKVEDINCDGCHAVGKRLIKFCDICEVRACGLERKIANCAHCEEYPCTKLTKLFEMIGDPNAKATLEEVSRSIKKRA